MRERYFISGNYRNRHSVFNHLSRFLLTIEATINIISDSFIHRIPIKIKVNLLFSFTKALVTCDLQANTAVLLFDLALRHDGRENHL